MDAIYLAPDPDREGEAIAAHLAFELGGNGHAKKAKKKKKEDTDAVRRAFSALLSTKLPSVRCRRRSSILAPSTRTL